MDSGVWLNALRDWLERPLARSLLLSAALHAALVMLIQPSTLGRTQTLVIHARIAPVPTLPPPSAADQSTPSAEPTPQPTAPIPEPVTAAPPPATPTGPSIESPPPAVQAETPAHEPMPVVSGTQGGSEKESALPQVPVMVDTTWYTARQVDRRPVPLDARLPAYPEEARLRGIQGSVVVELQIDELGRVQDLEIIESDPPGVFDDAVRQAYGEARYAPALREGRPVRYRGKYRVSFELD